MLEDGVPAAHQQRDRADAADQVEKQVAARQRRMQPRQQEHAGLHHRRRVQVGRHRRRRRHGMRQPELERELRALGEHRQQHQHQRIGIQRAGQDLRPRGQHHVEFVAAGDAAQQDHAAQQRQAAGAGDGQGHAGAVAGVLAVAPEADQQEGADRGELPEHRQQDQVAGDHHAQHRAHEQQQEGQEARHAVVFRQVVAGIENDQRADAQHQAGEHPGQAVEPQRQVQAHGRDPRHQAAHAFARHHVGGHQGQQHQPGNRRQPGQPGGRTALVVGQQAHQQREHKRGGQH